MPKVKSGQLGGRIAAGRGGDLPGDIGVGQGSAGIIFGFDGDGGAAAGEVRSGGLVAGGDFELGPAEFLDLEGVVELLLRSSRCRLPSAVKIKLGIAQVDLLVAGEMQSQTRPAR